MDKLQIEILPPENMKAILSKQTIGKMAETYSCNIEWDNGKVTKAFIKRFTHSRSLALVNELTGYIIAKGCGLPIPNHAALISVPPSVFSDESGQYGEWCFVVSSVPGNNPVSFFDAGQIAECQALMNLVAGWSKVSETIAFDDWVANQDRNLGNVMVAGKDKIYLIDHSNLPVDLNWSANLLDPHLQSKNVLANNLWHLGCAPLPIKSKVAMASNAHSNVYNEIKSELLHWWSILLSNDPDRLRALEKFVEVRATLGSERISQNMNMLAV